MTPHKKTMRRLVPALLLAASALLGAACIPSDEPWVPLDSGYAAGADGWTPTAPQNPAQASEIVDNRNVDLTWYPNRPNSYLGTSAETDNLGVEVEAGDVVRVTYSLFSRSANAGSTMPANGSIRLFSYLGVTGAIGDRPEIAPTYSATGAVGCTRNCVLEFTASEAGTLGYTGLVYDTSNGGVQGRVRFTDLTVDGDLILFK